MCLRVSVCDYILSVVQHSAGPVSRVWSDAQLPTHAGVHTFNRTAPSTQPQATFDVFEDDIDNSSSASTGGVRAESEGLRVRPAGEISTSEALAANPLRGFGTLRSSVSRPQPPLAQPPPTAPSHPPTAPLRDKGKEAVKGEKEGNEPEPIAEYLPLFSIGAGLSFEELRARDYRVKSPKQASGKH